MKGLLFLLFSVGPVDAAEGRAGPAFAFDLRGWREVDSRSPDNRVSVGGRGFVRSDLAVGARVESDEYDQLWVGPEGEKQGVLGRVAWSVRPRFLFGLDDAPEGLALVTWAVSMARDVQVRPYVAATPQVWFSRGWRSEAAPEMSWLTHEDLDLEAGAWVQLGTPVHRLGVSLAWSLSGDAFAGLQYLLALPSNPK